MTSLGGVSPAGGIKEQLGTIHKQISEAQTLDANGDEMVGLKDESKQRFMYKSHRPVWPLTYFEVHQAQT
jgi:hypothetical protein